MQFDVTGFLIFLAFILPGFLAQRARYSLAPRSLKPLSAVAEVGEFVLTGVWVHVFLVILLRLFFGVLEKEYFARFVTNFHYDTLSQFLWTYRDSCFAYLVLSLAVGYCFGFAQGWSIIRQPIRSWLVRRPFPNRVLRGLGIPGFMREDPVWYYVLRRETADTMVFLQVEMKNGGGIYTGTLMAYGILDDSVKSKDFYLEDVHFKESRSGSFTRLDCNGILVSFEDVASIQVRKGEPEEFLSQH